MLNDAEWGQIKNQLFDLYEKKNLFSNQEVEKLLQTLLVKNSSSSDLTD